MNKFIKKFLSLLLATMIMGASAGLILCLHAGDGDQFKIDVASKSCQTLLDISKEPLSFSVKECSDLKFSDADSAVPRVSADKTVAIFISYDFSRFVEDDSSKPHSSLSRPAGIFVPELRGDFIKRNTSARLLI